MIKRKFFRDMFLIGLLTMIVSLLLTIIPVVFLELWSFVIVGFLMMGASGVILQIMGVDYE